MKADIEAAWVVLIMSAVAWVVVWVGDYLKARKQAKWPRANVRRG